MAAIFSFPRSPAPTSQLQLSYLPAFLVVGEVTVPRKASRAELSPGVWVLVGLVEMWTHSLSDIAH